jgi:hypothetical protein
VGGMQRVCLGAPREEEAAPHRVHGCDTPHRCGKTNSVFDPWWSLTIELPNTPEVSLLRLPCIAISTPAAGAAQCRDSDARTQPAAALATKLVVPVLEWQSPASMSAAIKVQLPGEEGDVSVGLAAVQNGMRIRKIFDIASTTSVKWTRDMRLRECTAYPAGLHSYSLHSCG